MEKGEDLRDSQETYEKQNGTLQATHMTIYWHVSMNEQQDHLWMMLWICVLLDHRPLSADTDPILYIVLIISNISLLVITFVIIKKKDQTQPKHHPKVNQCNFINGYANSVFYIGCLYIV